MYLETKHNCCFVNISQLSVQHVYVFKSHFMLAFSFWNGLGFNFIVQISFWHMIRQQILNDGSLKWIFIYRWMYRWCGDVCIYVMCVFVNVTFSACEFDLTTYLKSW